MKKKEILAALMLVMFLAAVLIPFASQFPDGLEKVAIDQGFASQERHDPAVPALLAGYQVPGIGDKVLSSAISGIIGALAMFCIGWGIAVLLKKRKSR